jgi:aryl-alcohol dehydrogenase-like predicted oxidoreductase
MAEGGGIEVTNRYHPNLSPPMINRREFLGTAAGASATLALSPELLNAFRALQQSGGRLIQRAVPSTGEMLPVISFDPAQESDTAGMKEILKVLMDSGGKVIDFPHGGGEEVARAAANELGVQDKLFWTTSLSVSAPNVGAVLPGAIRKVDPAAVRTAMEAKLAKFKVPMIDLVMISASSDVTTIVGVLREMKKEGKLRYVGVHELTPPPYPTDAPFARLESIMRTEPIDFVGTDYSAGWRNVEAKILPLAMERKIGFMAHFTFDRGRLLQRASGTPLPEWAAEFDARTWPQFVLKYVVSHPGVVTARVGTTKPAHMLDNVGGGIGRLPNEAMRKRMAEFVDALPARQNPNAPVATPGRTTISFDAPQPSIVVSAAILDRYVGEYRHTAVGTTVSIRRNGDRLLFDVNGSGREPMIFVARSETRFASGQIFSLEFQVDGQGTVTGATWEVTLPAGMPQERIPLERK